MAHFPKGLLITGPIEIKEKGPTGEAKSWSIESAYGHSHFPPQFDPSLSSEETGWPWGAQRGLGPEVGGSDFQSGVALLKAVWYWHCLQRKL